MANIDNLNKPHLTEEEKLLVENTELSHSDVVELTGRSYASVKYHRKKLKVNVNPAASRINYWTEEDKDFLRTNSDKTNKEIAGLLGRTEGGVNMIRQKLKIESSRDYWSDEELEELANDYRTRNAVAIANSLGRTVTSIRSKALQLGLTKNVQFWTKPEMEILQANLDKTPTELQSLLPYKSMPQISYKKAHTKFVNSQKAIDDSDIDTSTKLSTFSIKLRYAELLNTLEIGHSIEYPSSDKNRVMAAARELSHKRFITRKKKEETTRQVFRID